MNKDLVKAKCDKVLMSKQSDFSKLLRSRIQRIYDKYEDSIAQYIDYALFTDFISETLSSFTGVVSEAVAETIADVLSEDEEIDEDFDLM